MKFLEGDFTVCARGDCSGSRLPRVAEPLN